MNDWVLASVDAELTTLFASGFLAATLLPGGSEAVLLYLASESSHSLLTLLVVATTANTLGGFTSWGLGRLAAWRWPPERLGKRLDAKAMQRIQRWGAPALIFSWLPLAGDPLCVAAGWLRLGWLQSLLWMALGKGLRYAVLLGIFL